MTDLTTAQLEALRALERAATPGEWETDYANNELVATRDAENCYDYLADFLPDACNKDYSQCAANAAFIAALRNAAPALLDMAGRVAAANERIAQLEALLEASTSAINAAIEQTHAEYQGHDKRADKFDKIVCEYRSHAARLLTPASLESQPPQIPPTTRESS